MSYLDANPTAIVAEILKRAEIVANAYRDAVPIRIPCKAQCSALHAHPDFEPSAADECRVDGKLRPHRPGLLGTLAGKPVYYSPVRHG